MTKKAKEIIKKELKRKNITYKELANLLNEKYILNTTQHALRSSINRGKFSFELALRIFEVLNIDLILKDKDNEL